MIRNLGFAVNNLANSTGNGNGCLIFFSSYDQMNECKKIWTKVDNDYDSESVIFDKTIRFEDKNPDAMKKIFQEHINDC